MSSDQLSEEQIFEAAFVLETDEARNEYLQQVCRDEEQIRRIQSLLKEGAADASFLEQGPAVLQGIDDRPADLPERIGDFEILGELGRGGMGVVYRARQCSLNRLVALKVLSAGLGVTTKAIMRFKLEAEAAAKLHHTNIVPIYWTGEEKRVPYYAMELIDGPSLDRVIKQLRAEASEENVSSAESRDDHVPEWIRETLISSSPAAGDGSTSAGTSTFDSSTSLGTDSSYYDNLARMMADVADALAHAHNHGIVHRDIKPANLLLSADGRLSINDFGLARMLEQPGMTMTGELMGSPMYMSPEQITAGRLPLDHRTDIYSLGATLYELLTLEPPFAGQQRDQVLSQVIHKDPPKPRTINPRIPKDLETICMKAMEKDPDRRYQTAEMLAEDLRRFVNRHAISARRVGPVEKGIRWVRKNKAISAMACLVVVVCASAVGYVVMKDRAYKRDQALNEALEKAMSGQAEQAKGLIKTAIRYGADENWEPMIASLEAIFVGNAAEAVEKLKTVVKNDPENLTAQWMLAEAYVSNGKWKPCVELVEELGDRYPERPEERAFAGLALSLLEPQKSIDILNKVVDEKRQLVYAQNALAFAMVFQAIDTRGGDSTWTDKALEELRTASGNLHEDENPALAMTRLYAHVTKAFLEYARKGEDQQAKEYLETNAKTDADILAKYPQYQAGNVMRMYYYERTQDIEGMFKVMQAVVAHHHGGWIADSFWVTCFMDPEWAHRDPKWKNRSLVEEARGMLKQLPNDRQLEMSRGFFDSKLPVGLFAAHSIEEAKLKDDVNGESAETRYFRGLITEKQFVEEAGDSERRRCQAFFAIGMKKLMLGERDEAKAAFKECVDGTLFHWTPYHWSRALLYRLEKDPYWPPPMPVPTDDPE